MTTKLKTLIKNGESIIIKFKESKSKLNKDIYETVCTFLNSYSGNILLDITDNGIIVGVAADKAEDLKKDFLTSINNAKKLNALVCLKVDIIAIDTNRSVA